jgi:hypothetical protein
MVFSWQAEFLERRGIDGGMRFIGKYVGDFAVA